MNRNTMRRRVTALFLMGILVSELMAGQAAWAAELVPRDSGNKGLVIKDGDVIAVCGDSITYGPYSKYINAYLLVCCELKNVKICNVAMFGKDTPFLLEHIDTHVLPHKPTVVTICMGMNSAGKLANLVKPNAEKQKTRLADATRDVIDRFRNTGVRTILLGSSSPTDTDTMRNRKPTNEDSPRATECNKSLAHLRDLYRGVAEEKGTVWVDVFDDFTGAMAKAKQQNGRSYYVAGPDGVHPSANGQLCIAYSFLRAMGCDGEIGTISLDLTKNAATATDGHRILSVKAGTMELESTRYPYCFFPDKEGNFDSPNTPISVLSALPFNRDLNRFVLKVTVTKDKKYEITWGTETVTVSAKELTEGVNLAELFVRNNPFHKPFRNVASWIHERAGAFGKLQRTLSKWDRTLPKSGVHIGYEKRVARSEKRIQEAHKPVKHIIQIRATALSGDDRR